MIRIQLTEDQRQDLQHLFKTTNDTKLKSRIDAVLLSDQGWNQTQIAEILNVVRSTIYTWLTRFNKQGVTGLKIKWSPGRPPLIPEEYGPIIIEWAKNGPQAYGLNRANWTFAELATHLYQTKGIKVSETTMRDFCHRHNVRPYRPTYRYLRADRQKQDIAKRELADLKKSPK